MKYNKLSFTFFLMICFGLIISSCEKEFSVENYNTTTNPGGGTTIGGGTTGGADSTDTTRNCRACAYLPVCSGSVYNYLDSSDIIETNTLGIDVVKDTTIDGKIFQKIISEGVYTYMNCTNGESTILEYLVTTAGGNTMDQVKRILLKDNVPVNTTWNATVNGQNVDYVSKIISKGPRTVNGINYPDVIEVQVKNNFTPAGAMDIEHLFYARGVGTVEYIIYDSQTGAVNFHRILQSYNIP